MCTAIGRLQVKRSCVFEQSVTPGDQPNESWVDRALAVAAKKPKRGFNIRRTQGGSIKKREAKEL